MAQEMSSRRINIYIATSSVNEAEQIVKKKWKMKKVTAPRRTCINVSLSKELSLTLSSCQWKICLGQYSSQPNRQGAHERTALRLLIISQVCTYAATSRSKPLRERLVYMVVA